VTEFPPAVHQPVAKQINAKKWVDGKLEYQLVITPDNDSNKLHALCSTPSNQLKLRPKRYSPLTKRH
jgi:hypothetical protein